MTKTILEQWAVHTQGRGVHPVGSFMTECTIEI